MKAEEGERGRPHRPGEERPDYNYEGVISLLREHTKVEPSAIPSHNVSINLRNNALHTYRITCVCM